MAGAKKIQMVEPLPKIWVPFNKHSLLGKRVVQIKQLFLVFNGLNRTGAGAKNFWRLEPEPEI